MGSATVFWVLLGVVFVNSKGVLAVDGKCEEITIPMCKEIGYNFTRLPNQFNHETQDEVRYYLFLFLTDLVNFGAERLIELGGDRRVINEQNIKEKCWDIF